MQAIGEKESMKFINIAEQAKKSLKSGALTIIPA